MSTEPFIFVGKIPGCVKAGSTVNWRLASSCRSTPIFIPADDHVIVTSGYAINGWARPHAEGPGTLALTPTVTHGNAVKTLDPLQISCRQRGGRLISWYLNEPLDVWDLPNEWTDVVAMRAYDGVLVGLTPNGRCISFGMNSPIVGDNIEMIAAGSQYALLVERRGGVDSRKIIRFPNHYLMPTPTSMPSVIVAIAAGRMHGLALLDTGRVVAWGQNNYGQTNVPAAAQSGIVAIEASGDCSFAITDTGCVIAWGRGDFGALNVPAAAMADIVAVATYGNSFAMALTADGRIVTWGIWSGTGPDYLGLHNAPTGAGFTAIAAGRMQAAALTADGHVVAWGVLEEVLGWGTNGITNVLSPPTVQAAAGAGNIAIAISYSSICALTTEPT